MIRKAKQKDIPTIIDLLIQVNMVHHNNRPDIFNGPATKYDKEELIVMMEDANTPIFVYTNEEDQVLGYAFCIFIQHKDDAILTDIKSLYIDDLCVDKDARGQHIGQKLYDYVVEYAKEKECYNVTLNVWAKNQSAIDFYKRMGLEPQKIGMEKIL